MASALSTPSQTPRKQWTLYARRACSPFMKMDTRSAAESERYVVGKLTVTDLIAQTNLSAVNRKTMAICLSGSQSAFSGQVLSLRCNFAAKV